MHLQPLRPDHDLTHLDGALRYVRNWRVAVDGGAHVGIWTRALLARFERVIAIEPVAENAMRIPIDAEIHPAALGKGAGRVSLMPGLQNTGQWHVGSGDDVPMITVDSLHLSACDLLKLDVEGYELPALEGAADTIDRCRPVVIIEENGLCRRYGIESGAAGAFLRGMGMHLAATFNRDEVFTW